MANNGIVKVGVLGYGTLGYVLSKWLIANNPHCCVLISDPPKGYDNDISDADVFFINIHIPTESDGSQNIVPLKDIIKKLPDKPIFIRTTLIPGTCDNLKSELNKRIYFMPEFLTERRAYEDFCLQPMIFCGEINLLRKVFVGKRYEIMSSIEAEIAKYAHNVFGALKVTFFNGIYEYSLQKGCDYENIRKGVLLSGYINKEHTSVPGHDLNFGYGGKCFPKDVKAFIKAAKGCKLNSLIKLVESLNSHYRKKAAR
jgi:UDPglucose 6-dehydrogenase